MVLWGDAFWSEGNRGFEVLSSNVKNGAIAIEEFQRFLNESVQCESIYCKSISRLQAQLIKTQHVGTFTPIWYLIRDIIDKISSAHSTTVNLFQDLLRDVHTYQDLYQKKVKTQIQKDIDITRSTDLMSQLTNAFHTVNKAKEQYHSIAIDYERTKRSGNSALNNLSTSASQDSNSPGLAQSAINSFAMRQLDRLEKKYRQAQDEYKTTIERYNLIRNEYEKRFHDACTKFQDFEIDHIEKMLVYSLNYSDILQRYSEQIGIAQTDFTAKLKSLTGPNLLDSFVEQKKTGTEPPIALQFEDIDNLRAPMSSANLESSTVQDDFNLFDQVEPNVPAFQAHFAVPSTPTKPVENSRTSMPNAASSGAQTPPNNAIVSPPMNHQITSSSPIIANSATTRTSEAMANNEQTTNPFDLKIRKPKFPGFFGSVRKEKKDKKLEKKSSFTAKSRRAFQSQHSHEGTAGNMSQSTNNEYNDFNASMDKSKDANFDPFGALTPFDEINSNQNTKLSSKRSSTSSDFSDDDDDNLMLKINVKINPKAEATIDADADDDNKIMNAMRLIDKNIANTATTSRGSPLKISDTNKSTSNEQINTRPLPPPPLPSRPTTTLPNNIATNSFDQLSMFPPHQEFDRTASNTSDPPAPFGQDSFFLFPQLTNKSKSTTPVSSNEDDSEVANSFFNDNLTDKTSILPVLQPPSLLKSNQQQSALSPFNTQTMAPINANFRNSPTVSNDQGMSPLTIGATDQIPLAIAFQETIHVMMCGNDRKNWKSRIIGDMLISFPASILTLLSDPERFANKLQFQLKNLDNIEKINVKSPPITENESSYSFDMTELNNILRNLHEKTPSSRFFNLNVLNYEVKNLDLSNIPIEISSQWTRTFDTISVTINYRFNSSLLPESVRINNDTVIFYTIITDGEQIKESLPSAEWSTHEHKLWWKVPYIRNGTGNLSATVITVQADPIENDNDNDDQLEQPLTTSSIINAYFIGENALFSPIDIDLTSRGKYQSEPDQSEPIHLFQRPTISPSSTDQ
ncbi:hypothetical protein I4U23_028189 [Adineta vaga]|nr:hypothetical protein I4U23_028189 [Adineta vaga]